MPEPDHSAESARKVAGWVVITPEMAEDIRRTNEAMAQPVSREAYEAWLNEPDEDDDDLITLPDGAYFFHEEGWTVTRDIKGRGWKVARIDGDPRR